MKTFASSAAAAAFLASNVAAFPTINLDAKRALAPQGVGALPLVPPPFDASRQYVSNTGAHAFSAPSSSDERGECPGLNALANHNYLPHNGQATIPQFISATYEGFGMAQDLAGFLAVYGAVVDGDGTSWSIGGVPHTGILGSHNDYEADSSPLKSDLNQYGSNGRLIMSQFQTLYNMQPDAATANYNLEVMRAFRGKRFTESIDKNPYFVYAPFTGIEVSQAAFTFIYRFMSNKSAENPEGVLNKHTLKSFMSISGPEDNLVWTQGHEAFPDNWYKRNDADQYSIPYFQTDILYFAETIPEILVPGCNQGKVNSFKTISSTSLLNLGSTVESALKSPFCFAAQFGIASARALGGLTASQESALKKGVSPYLSSAGCSTSFPTASLTQLKNCPGFSFYGGPSGPVAPGAIQS
ncbi:MAG: hypothetical protein M1828_003159 [Chrysothrix sp. TS-e1954]|nr:MAG: hypothetical protein M1828_003159 [Chrysothrix sp. TS-e1954]